MYEHFVRSFGGRGSAAEVWIDKEAKLVKKYYKFNGIGHAGNVIVENNYDKLKYLWQTEIEWSEKLHEFSVTIRDYGEIENGFYIIQDYYNPDLLVDYCDKTLHENYPRIREEIVEFFELCKKHNIYKQNHALSNMTGKDGKLKVFDFKYVEPRREDNRKWELKCIHEWVCKIDEDLVPILESLV